MESGQPRVKQRTQSRLMSRSGGPGGRGCRSPRASSRTKNQDPLHKTRGLSSPGSGLLGRDTRLRVLASAPFPDVAGQVLDPLWHCAHPGTSPQRSCARYQPLQYWQHPPAILCPRDRQSADRRSGRLTAIPTHPADGPRSRASGSASGRRLWCRATNRGQRGGCRGGGCGRRRDLLCPGRSTIPRRRIHPLRR